MILKARTFLMELMKLSRKPSAEGKLEPKLEVTR